MAKDDYYVIVYQILSYLYTCLKKDLPVNEDNLSWQESKYFKLNDTAKLVYDSTPSPLF